MAFGEVYRCQAALPVRILPHVAKEECFALKGGTAINLFVRDMPRLSVDIDLTYLPLTSRRPALRVIDAALKRVAQRIRKALGSAQITATETKPENEVIKLLVRDDGVQVKIEVTPVLRGCVYVPELRRVAPSVEAAFGFAEMRVVSFADLYAGKIVAALDRQHPRDLFDVRDLLANEGINDDIRRAFVVYLLSHNRPMAEILAPARKSIATEFERVFDGMTAHWRFLISFERGEPDWALLGVAGERELPAVRWRQRNLDRLATEERTKLASRLEKVLLGSGKVG